MINLTALFGLGATGLYVNEHACQEQRAVAQRIIETFGICVTVNRKVLLDEAKSILNFEEPETYIILPLQQ